MLAQPASGHSCGSCTMGTPNPSSSNTLTATFHNCHTKPLPSVGATLPQAPAQPRTSRTCVSRSGHSCTHSCGDNCAAHRMHTPNRPAGSIGFAAGGIADTTQMALAQPSVSAAPAATVVSTPRHPDVPTAAALSAAVVAVVGKMAASAWACS